MLSANDSPHIYPFLVGMEPPPLASRLFRVIESKAIGGIPGGGGGGGGGPGGGGNSGICLAT